MENEVKRQPTIIYNNDSASFGIKRLPLKLVSVATRKNQIPMHRDRGADFNQFLWIEDGEGKFYMGDHKFTLSKGKGIFIRHDVMHGYYGDMVTGWCSFLCDDSFISYVLGNAEYRIFDMTEQLRKDAESLAKFARGNCSTLALSSAGYTYVTEFFEYITSNKDDVIDKVNQYFERHYSGVISLDDIAEKLGIDKFTLCKYYKKQNGTTIIDDLLKFRIFKAKRMLKYDDNPIEKVGIKCGFESPSYFCKKFREHTGDTPLQYRKKHI